MALQFPCIVDLCFNKLDIYTAKIAVEGGMERDRIINVSESRSTQMMHCSKVVVVDKLTTVHFVDHVWIVKCDHAVILLHMADAKALRIEW